VYVALPWDEVPFNIARSLLVAINCDHALRAWDFHVEVESLNGRFKLVDGAPAHYGVVGYTMSTMSNVTCSLRALGATPNDRGSFILPTGKVPLSSKPYRGLSEGLSKLWLMPMRSKACKKMMSA
jgi:hypothetical protein